MKVTFLGGGSLRLLPLFRGIFARVPEFFRGGEICLIDLQKERAEAVARLVQTCPEFPAVKCKVTCHDNLDDALPGTDLMYLTMAASRQPSYDQAMALGIKYDYIASDNLSVNGAFLAMRIGSTILNIARAMEKHCPKALMLIFPNPVSVYSHLVNTHTSIRALGICGGFNNHRHDLTRLTTCQDGFDADWDVVAAGINHVSYILRGSLRGKDLYSDILPNTLHEGWRAPAIPSAINPKMEKLCQAGLEQLCKIYLRYGTMIFSSEMDGMAHINWEWSIKWQREFYPDKWECKDPAAVKLASEKRIQDKFAKFMEAAKHPDTIDWNAINTDFSLFDKDITIPIFQALAGIKKMRIVASRPNYGAVKDFGPDVPLEYTMDIMGDKITAVENQYIPAPFFGLTASLAEFQRLQAEAIASGNPRIFADALDAYPKYQFTQRSRQFFREMFDIFTDLDPKILEAKKFF